MILTLKILYVNGMTHDKSRSKIYFFDVYEGLKIECRKEMKTLFLFVTNDRMMGRNSLTQEVVDVIFLVTNEPLNNLLIKL